MMSKWRFETAENRELEDDILLFPFCDGIVEILAERGDAADILGVVMHEKSITSTCSNGNLPKLRHVGAVHNSLAKHCACPEVGYRPADR
jgi:hypothetical protein